MNAASLRGAIESQPAVDGAAGELDVGNAEGMLTSLRSADGAERWQRSVGGPVRSSPALSTDAVFVITASDAIVALSRFSALTICETGTRQSTAQATFIAAGPGAPSGLKYVLGGAGHWVRP